MCFSAGASFGAGAVLLTAGALSMSASKSKGTRLLACVPLFFGIQQCSEGLLWLALRPPPYQHWERMATYAFLFFAEVLWPVMVPLTVWALEPEPKRKKVLAGFLGLGICVALYLLTCLIIGPVDAFIREHHIRYEVKASFLPKHLNTAVYCLAAVVPPFISSRRYLRRLGVFLLCSLIVTALFYTGYLISVWCFFAALLSAAIYLFIKRHGKHL